MFRRSLAVAALVAGCWTTPLAAQTCAPFTDVPATHPFCSDIQWMFNRGVTTGCGAGIFCPALNVTREQMAAFMHRLANVTFQQGGNAFGAPAVLGTTDGQFVDVRANNARALRLQQRQSTVSGAGAVNVIGGHAVNDVQRNCSNPLLCVGFPDEPVGGTIAGGGREGSPNRVWDDYGTIGGGVGNSAGSADGESANAVHATVAGGQLNAASGPYAAVLGGFSNGAAAAFAVVLGGESNLALGAYSLAAGQNAHALNRGCFTWADASSIAAFQCSGDNAFVARSAGGVYFRTNAAATTGVDLFGGASAWSIASDRALKERVAAVDPLDVLDRLVRMPVATWNYRAQDATIRHMGPMAQDVHAAFGLGESDRHISTVDADGIAFAAIQGLNAKLESALRDKDARIAALEARAGEVDALRAELSALRDALALDVHKQPEAAGR